MFIVVSVEHTESFDNVPMYLGKFETLDEAKAFKQKKIEESIKEFPQQERDGDFLYTTAESGDIDYGYVITIFEVK